VTEPEAISSSQRLPRAMALTSVSYFMNKFRKLGLISYNGRIEVHNSLLSAVLHDKPQLNEDKTDGT
jgi:CRP/FNR family transcriptional regulator, cyclic AMP receptor protein